MYSVNVEKQEGNSVFVSVEFSQRSHIDNMKINEAIRKVSNIYCKSNKIDAKK